MNLAIKRKVFHYEVVPKHLICVCGSPYGQVAEYIIVDAYRHRFLERGFRCIDGGGVALLILTHS